MIPTQADLSKLKGILGNSKRLMKKVETGDYESGNIDGRALTENGVAQLQAEGVRRPTSSTSNQAPVIDNSMISNSGLPESVKQAMINNPIPQVNPYQAMNNTFTLDDVPELVEKPMPHPSNPRTNPRRDNNHYEQPVNESRMYTGGNNMITISENELRSLMRDELLKFMAETYKKTITEDAVKKTINTLIKEGKIVTRKKKVVR